MKLIFKNGSILEKLEKVRILDNMREEIIKKIYEGVEFSNEATLALAVFPVSDAETVFAIIYNKIVKAAHKFKIENPKNWGYSFAEFHPSRNYMFYAIKKELHKEKLAEQQEKKDWVCYYISERELQKIGWTDAANVPDFVTEVFQKLGCEPDEITN